MTVRRSFSQDTPIALIGGTLVDGQGNDPVKDSVILINGPIIDLVGTKSLSTIPRGCKVIDIAGHTVIPGMMDLHVHLCFGKSDPNVWAGGVFPPLMEHPLPLIGIKGFARARRAFQMGFTTLRDVGDIGYLGIAVRDAVRSGTVEGPRVVACGAYLNATSGYANPLPPWLTRNDVPPSVADGVDGIIRYVRTQVRMNTDWIKYVATGGATVNSWDEQQFSDEEVAALVGEAHRKGRPVAAHCVQAKGTLQAVKAGVDSIEHGSSLSEEICAGMKANGSWLVPTLSPLFRMVECGERADLSADRVQAARAILDRHVSSFKMAKALGVQIAMGTDSGWSPSVHGENARELELLVKVGMTPMDALLTATSRSADALRLGDKLGRIEAGMFADIVVVNGNPLDDIKLLQNRDKIALVIKGGQVYPQNLII